MDFSVISLGRQIWPIIYAMAAMCPCPLPQNYTWLRAHQNLKDLQSFMYNLTTYDLWWYANILTVYEGCLPCYYLSLAHWDRHKIAADIFKCIFWNENIWISIKKIHLSLFRKVQSCIGLDNGLAPSEPNMVNFLTHICVTRPQWVNKHYCVVFLIVYLCSKVIKFVLQCRTVIFKFIMSICNFAGSITRCFHITY